MNMIGPGHIRTVGETSIAWWELGEGEPVVLLHGVGDSHRTWRRLAPRLAERYRVLMPDLPGHGLSGKPDAPYTLSWFSQTILAWLQTIGVSQAHVVGHSYGGGVAQWMLLDGGVRITRLGLIAPGGFGRDVSLGLRLPTLPLLGPALTPAFMRHGTRVLMRLALGSRADLAEERSEIERLVWMNSAPGSGVAFQRTLAGCIDLFGQYVQTSQRIDEISALPPTAIFWGERDVVLPVRHAHAAAERIAGATLTIYPRAGHFPHLDEGEVVARDLIDLFERPAAGRASEPALGPTSRPRARRMPHNVFDVISSARERVRAST